MGPGEGANRESVRSIEPHLTLTGWLDAISEAGGAAAAGSAAALAGALGVALLAKLARLTPAEAMPEAVPLLAQLQATQAQLVALARADAAAVSTWLAYRHLPAGEPVREEALQVLIQGPLEAADLCREVQRAAHPLLERGHSPAVPDGQAGLRLVEVCGRIMLDLVRADLPLMQEAQQRATLAARLERLEEA
jgi:formiminotetrahydrofolate cyclodeaminase